MDLQDFLKLNEEQQLKHLLALESEQLENFLDLIKKDNPRSYRKLQAKLNSTRQQNSILNNKIESGDSDDNKYIELNKIKPNPFQPRKTFNKIDSLGESIHKVGLTHAIAVTKRGDEYILIAGERRLRAFYYLLEKYGEKYLKIKADIFLDITDEQLEDIALTENVQREDMTIFETADAFKSLSDKGKSLRVIQELSGKGKTSVHRYVKIASLPEQVKELFKDIKTTATNKLELLCGLETVEEQLKYANMILEDVGFDKLKKLIENKDIQEDKKPQIQTIEHDLYKIKPINKIISIKKYEKLPEENRVEVDNIAQKILKLQEKLEDIIKK